MAFWIIILCFAAWAVLHSFLASRTAKDRARELFGPSVRVWYRFAFVAVAVVTLAPTAVMLFVLPDAPLYSVPSPWRWIMKAGQAVSAVLLVWTVLQTRPMRFTGVEQLLQWYRSRRDGRKEESRTEGPEHGDTNTCAASGRGSQAPGKPRLVQRGLYGLVRHPMYLFSLPVMWLAPVMTVNRLTLYALISLYFFVGTFHEEKLLIAEFGDDYREYQRRVPRIMPLPRRRQGTASR